MFDISKIDTSDEAVIERLNRCVQTEQRAYRCDTCEYQGFLDCKDVLLNDCKRIIEKYTAKKGEIARNE